MSEDGGDAKKGKSDECIQVVVRCRPLSKKEKDENRAPIIDVNGEDRQIAIKNPAALNDAPKSFTFDGTFDEFTQQKFFYEEACFSLIESVLEGFNGTIFAYGQTGLVVLAVFLYVYCIYNNISFSCGKSWTMQGLLDPPELKGVIPNSFSHIFEFVKATKDAQFLIRCSYLEIYNEEIRDLLCHVKNAPKCEMKEDPNTGVFVKNLTNVVVESVEDMTAQLNKGLSFRTVAATLMNSESSRSHSIFSIVVEMSTKDETGKEHLRAGKLNLVDLAGSERPKKTGATGDTLKEGAKINLSLTVLGNVISALADGKGKHIPYRESKLTRLLQDSLGGNTKTLMIAAVSPADYNYDETLSTLKYANRAKNIKNKPKINEDPKDAMIREFKEEIERLKKLLMDHQMNGMGSFPALPMMQMPSSMAMAMSMQPTSGGAAMTTTATHPIDQVSQFQHQTDSQNQPSVSHSPRSSQGTAVQGNSGISDPKRAESKLDSSISSNQSESRSQKELFASDKHVLSPPSHHHHTGNERHHSFAHDPVVVGNFRLTSYFFLCVCVCVCFFHFISWISNIFCIIDARGDDLTASWDFASLVSAVHEGEDHIADSKGTARDERHPSSEEKQTKMSSNTNISNSDAAAVSRDSVSNVNPPGIVQPTATTPSSGGAELNHPVSQDHLHRQKYLEDHTQNLEKEKKVVEEQLRLRESEIEKEKILRDEMNQRLLQLQHMVS